MCGTLKLLFSSLSNIIFVIKAVAILIFRVRLLKNIPVSDFPHPPPPPPTNNNQKRFMSLLLYEGGGEWGCGYVYKQQKGHKKYFIYTFFTDLSSSVLGELRELSLNIDLHFNAFHILVVSPHVTLSRGSGSLWEICFLKTLKY